MDNDVVKLRELSNYFYKTSGIYQKVCNYFASMYRYDWYVVPEVYDDNVKEDKILNTPLYSETVYIDDVINLLNSNSIITGGMISSALKSKLECRCRKEND